MPLVDRNIITQNSVGHDMIYHSYYKQLEVLEKCVLQIFAINDLQANIQINGA